MSAISNATTYIPQISLDEMQDQLDDLLDVAAENNDHKRMKVLLDIGADPNRLGKEGRTLLHDAASEGQWEVVEVLLNCLHTNPNIQDDTGATALHYAAAENQPRIAQMLLADQRIEPTLKSKDGHTILYTAAHHDSAELMRILVGDGRVDPNDGPIARVNSKTTPLVLAVRMNHPQAAKELLEDPLTDPNLGIFFTPLQEAIWGGSTAVAQVLLADSRTDRNIKDKCGVTPLHLAVINERTEQVSALLAGGADPNVQNIDGKSSLDTIRKKYKKNKNKKLERCFSEITKHQHSRAVTPLVFTWEKSGNKGLGELPRDLVQIIGEFSSAVAPLESS